MSFYDFKINKPNGEKIELSNYKGKVILAVNTATKCGLAPQFKGLEELHQKYNNSGLVVLGFPCAQFLNQEPESNETVEKACESKFGVTFQLTEKVDVNGANTHDIFKHLKAKKGGFLGSRIKWNFTKFLISVEGKVLKRYSPTTTPDIIESDIINLLSKI
ncbi:MAG: glutathione peroxidase [Flavobacteriales bacterium]|nr:glutathione peroxidase [Flavobacteriales bacterium]|tara:strand:+ start:10503 stop:10985 length:483 start_codon:yes stop_codon:yes gene_type:complete